MLSRVKTMYVAIFPPDSLQVRVGHAEIRSRIVPSPGGQKESEPSVNRSSVAGDHLDARLRGDHRRHGLADRVPGIVLGLDLEDLGRLVALDAGDLALAGGSGRLDP